MLILWGGEKDEKNPMHFFFECESVKDRYRERGR